MRRWAEFDRQGGIYIIGFGDYVKIGFSRDVGRRFRAIEPYAPKSLDVYAILFGGSPKQERALHRRFAKLQLKNELFRLASPLTEYIASHRGWRNYERLPPIQLERKFDMQRAALRSRSGLPPFVVSISKKGNVYFYVRRKGQPLIRLRGKPWSPEFMATYGAALANIPDISRDPCFKYNPGLV